MKTEQCIKNTAPTIIAKNSKILLFIGQIFTGTQNSKTSYKNYETYTNERKEQVFARNSKFLQVIASLI